MKWQKQTTELNSRRLKAQNFVYDLFLEKNVEKKRVCGDTCTQYLLHIFRMAEWNRK